MLPLLEERLVPAKELYEFALRVLSVVSGMIAGAPQGRSRSILQLVDNAAEMLGFGSHEAATARLSAVLSGLAESFHSEGASSEEPWDRRRLVADFAGAMGCPFPVGATPPEGPPPGREPTPEEVVDAASRFVRLVEEKDANPSLALRRLTMEKEGGEAGELHPVAVEAVLAASGEGRGQTRPEILIADSDAGARNMLALRLRNEGYTVRALADGRAALEEIRRQAPALVLSETVIPGLDGYALLDALKREGKGSIPFLFLSSRSDALSQNKGLLLGASDFLTKGVSFEVLLTKLEKALSQSVEMSEVSARLSLSDVTGATAVYEGPIVAYDELAPGVAIMNERFRIESDLGEGGMGKVFKAYDQQLEEQVVLKVLKPGLSDDNVLKRFKREIRLARKISHPGVVRIYDLMEAGPIKFVTMEYLEGADLPHELKRRGSFPVPVAMRVAVELFEALGAAHDVGVIHRDMKPHNVLMLSTGKVKVLDFGIAQGLEPTAADRATMTGFILGTPDYMSPEQLMAEQLDPRTDLYSTGVVLYQLLTGGLPFRGNDRVAAAQLRLSTEPSPPSTLNPKIPPQVDAAVCRLLRRNRDDRYASAEAVVADLAEIRRSLV